MTFTSKKVLTKTSGPKRLTIFTSITGNPVL